MKRTFKEPWAMIKLLWKEYWNRFGKPNRKDQRNCYKRILWFMIGMLWAKISAPVVYPIWWWKRKKLWTSENNNWKVIKQGVDANATQGVKELIKRMTSPSLYWLWTYGDLNDPLGRGGLPERYEKNSFWNRWRYSALRNARFNWHYMNLRTGPILDFNIRLDTRNFNLMHKSDGIGDCPDGELLMWFMDEKKVYFVYENCNQKAIWYFGWVGMKHMVKGQNGRFEISYRKTKESYFQFIQPDIQPKIYEKFKINN